MECIASEEDLNWWVEQYEQRLFFRCTGTEPLRALMIRKSTFVLIVTWNEWTFSGELSAPE